MPFIQTTQKPCKITIAFPTLCSAGPSTMEAAKTSSKKDPQRAGAQSNQCSGEGQDPAELHRPPAKGEHRDPGSSHCFSGSKTAQAEGLRTCCDLPDPPSSAGIPSHEFPSPWSEEGSSASRVSVPYLLLLPARTGSLS